MRRTNSFSSEMLYPNYNDNDLDKMFLSIKETLHHPLKKIKSKDLLNYFYKDANQKEEIQIMPISEKNKEIPLKLMGSSNQKRFDNNFIESPKENKINIEINNMKNKNIGRNNFLNKYKIKENSNSEIIDFNTSPNTNQDNNFDRIANIDDNINNTEPIKPNIYLDNEKVAMNEIKNIALKIKYKINSLKICENTSKLSIEKENSNNNKLNKLNTNNTINNNIFPFEFINNSFINLSNNSKKKDTQPTNNNISSKINDVKIETYKKEKKSKNRNEDFSYRNFIENLSNTKIITPEGDIYSREMAYREKKEKKLEEIRKKEIEEELKEYQFKPEINNISKKLTKNKTPIYKRIKEIEIEKNNKIEKLKENINKNENFDNNNKQKFNQEDFQKWLVSNENWNVKKLIKLNNIKRQVKKGEDLNYEQFRFHPAINKNSEKLFKSNNSLSSIPVSDRLCYASENREKYSRRKNDIQELSFNPKINKNYPISEKYYEFMEKDQFQIYNKNKQKNNKIK